METNITAKRNALTITKTKSSTTPLLSLCCSLRARREPGQAYYTALMLRTDLDSHVVALGQQSGEFGESASHPLVNRERHGNRFDECRRRELEQLTS
jgi:hypothetical protein